MNYKAICFDPFVFNKSSPFNVETYKKWWINLIEKTLFHTNKHKYNHPKNIVLKCLNRLNRQPFYVSTYSVFQFLFLWSLTRTQTVWILEMLEVFDIKFQKTTGTTDQLSVTWSRKLAINALRPAVGIHPSPGKSLNSFRISVFYFKTDFLRLQWQCLYSTSSSL